MTHRIGMAARFAAAATAATIVGAAALGGANAADWDRLKGSDWGGAQPSQQSQQSQASAGGFAGQVAGAFQDLGMAGARAECYGRVLQQELDADNKSTAVELLRRSTSSDDVRDKVTSQNFDIIGGFKEANSQCPEGMGS